MLANIFESKISFESTNNDPQMVVRSLLQQELLGITIEPHFVQYVQLVFATDLFQQFGMFHALHHVRRFGEHVGGTLYDECFVFDWTQQEVRTVEAAHVIV